ncbi:MAG: hypothetical protein V1777_04035 [Candidatus Micrarchaeota archaeon]
MPARASSSIEIIMWVGIVLATGILLFWYLQNFFAGSSIVQQMQTDLQEIGSRVNEACLSREYHSPYNLSLTSGDLNWNSGELCLCVNCQTGAEFKKCKKTNCAEKLLNANRPIAINEHSRLLIEAQNGAVTIRES